MKLKNKSYNDPNILKKQYVEDNLTIKEISELHSCSSTTIQKKIKQFNIKREQPLYQDKEWLYNEYITLDKSIDGLAKQFDCHNDKIYHHINKFKIKKKKIFENPNLLNYQYKTLGKSQAEIMIEFKVARTPLVNALKKFNIERNEEELNSFKKKSSNKKISSKIVNGYIKVLNGKTLPQISKEFKIPVLILQRYFKDKEKITKEEINFLSKAYSNRHTILENKIKKEINIEIYDKFPDLIKYPLLKYKPDFKLNDSVYLNVDGLFWHSQNCKNDNYHFKMRQDYELLGLRLFQFRENEVFNKLPIVKSIINNTLNKTEFKIGARETIIKKASSSEAQLFLNGNHIKGYKHAKHLGLYYQNELISLMSYKIKKNYKTKKCFLDISRFCSKINYNVIGAFNKLLKSIIEEVGEIPIYYWIDLRYEIGTFLIKNGFEVKKETLSWEWTDKKTTYNRLKCRANMDERKLSEKEYANELKWIRIYDAGQRLYVKN
jgi:LysM repeat protein